MLNPFFTQGTPGEQNLVQDLINEQLRTYGVDIFYMPRKFVTEKTVIREVVQSKFDLALPLEAYVDNYDQYSGAGNLLSKFGIESKDEVRLIISRERFETYITPLIQDQSNIKLSTRPKSGDLIWFPLDDRVYEIKDIEYAKPYYQLQNLYVYELYCELFRYENEVIATGVDDIDDNLVGDDSDGFTDDGINTIQGNTQTLTLVGTSSTATAVTGIITGSIRSIRITNRGGGYKTKPTVGIGSAPVGGITGIATVRMIGGINVCNLNSNSALKSVQNVDLVNPGSGYTIAPSIRIYNGGGTGAAATSILSEIANVGVVTITGAGGGYVDAPEVTFSTPKHVGAAATAVLDYPVVGGGVSVLSAPISIGASAYLFPGGTTGGVFYKEAPIVTFALPTGTGNASQATATLDSYAETGGTVETLAITTGGKFYTSTPTVVISHPGTSFASATIGIAGSSINPGSIAFSTTGRAYTTSPTVAITTSGTMLAPTQIAIGIATIHPITGIVTAVSFNNDDAWAVGTSATIGAGYTVAPTISFSGSPSPIQATATVTVSIAGTINSISIGNSGYGYVSVPTVTIGGPGGANEQFRALGIATIRFNSIQTQGTIGIGSTSIAGINTSNILVGDRVRLGVGHSEVYNFIPRDSYVTSIGSSAIFINNLSTNVGIATSVFEFGIDKCGIVTGIAVTFGGGGYLSPPLVSISNTVGDKNYIDEVVGVATAKGVVSINGAGNVSSIDITDSGNKYVLTPTITIESPGSGGTGDFAFNEVIIGSATSTTARVRTWNSTTGVLEVASVDGTFSVGETVVGSTSGASRPLRTLDKTPDNDPFADNFDIETAADSIIDFSEQNPFGIP